MASLKCRKSSAFACVEMMEGRQLLSASLMPSVKVKPAPPMLAGETFTGTATALGQSLPVSVTITTETSKGIFGATLVANGLTASAIGTVKATGAISWHGKAGKVGFVLNGKLNSALNTITGKYTDTGKRGSIHGPFSLTLVTG